MKDPVVEEMEAGVAVVVMPVEAVEGRRANEIRHRIITGPHIQDMDPPPHSY
jgi:hypothetical protein